MFEPIGMVNRDRFLQAERSVGRLIRSGLSPKDAVKQAAIKHSLEPEFVKRLAEVYNVTAQLKQIQSSPDLEVKLASVPLVNAAEVINEMYKETKSAKMEKAAAVLDTPKDYIQARPDYNSIWPMEKAADTINVSTEHAFIECKRELGQLNNQLTEKKAKLVDELWALEENLSKTVAELSKSATTFENAETRLLGLYGVQARNYLDELAKRFQPSKRGGMATTVLLTDFTEEPFVSMKSGVQHSIRLQELSRDIEKIKTAQEKIANTLYSFADKKLVDSYIKTTLGIDKAAEEASASDSFFTKMSGSVRFKAPMFGGKDLPAREGYLKSISSGTEEDPRLLETMRANVEKTMLDARKYKSDEKWNKAQQAATDYANRLRADQNRLQELSVRDQMRRGRGQEAREQMGELRSRAKETRDTTQFTHLTGVEWSEDAAEAQRRADIFQHTKDITWANEVADEMRRQRKFIADEEDRERQRLVDEAEETRRGEKHETDQARAVREEREAKQRSEIAGVQKSELLARLEAESDRAKEWSMRKQLLSSELEDAGLRPWSADPIQAAVEKSRYQHNVPMKILSEMFGRAKEIRNDSDFGAAKAKERIDLSSIFDDANDMEVAKIKAKSLIAELLSSDQIIKGHPAEDVAEAFNELIKVVPQMVDNKALARSLMREYLERQQTLDPHRILALEEARIRSEEREQPKQISTRSQR